MSVDFQLRAPWYDRERRDLELGDPRARRPVVQMYDGTDFVERVTADPGDSLEFGDDDRWSYPVPVTPGASATGKARFATSTLIYTGLRKLYQPAHSRFYAVVVEVFCDSAGLPRAGMHDDFDVTFVMRRQHTTFTGDKRAVRKLARGLLSELADDQLEVQSLGTPDLDLDELWWANEAERIRFEDDHALLFDKLDASTSEQAWMVGAAGSQWRTVDTPPADGRPEDTEQEFPMWRLPPRDGECDAARTRSLWFGLVPTFSAEHWTDCDGNVQSKLDEHEIYQLRCIVTKHLPPGREHCPPDRYVSATTVPFRLAAPFDPDGTKNHTVTIPAPDLRRLATRAGKKQGPGGVRIKSPPNSALSPVDFKKIPGAGLGKPGGGQICSFAFELFFIVALFLFLLFLPIVVLAFQLWWMLALRFCIPPSISFRLLGEFFAAGGVLADLKAGGANPAESAMLDEVIGVHDAATALLTPGTDFAAAPDAIDDLVVAMDPDDAQLTPIPPVRLTTPPDPLCQAST